MSGPAVAPYGSWRSPITAELVARRGVRLYEPTVVDDAVWWLELRPAEDGRHVVVRADAWSAPADVTPSGFNARTKVHEYGGGSYAASGPLVFFANFADQRVYRQELGGAPEPVTPEPPRPGSVRHADLRVSPDGRFIACVRERHEGDGEVVNELAMLPADGSADPWTVVGGHDFIAAARFSPDGTRLAWTCWDHPRMPWDGTELFVADIADGKLGEPRRVAGSPSESVLQPGFSPDGRLHFVSDRTGWWNLYREEADGAQSNLTPMAAEFAAPPWLFGNSSYGFLGDGRIACLYRRGGVHHLAMLDPATSELLDLDLPYSCYPPYLSAEGTRLAFIAGGPDAPNQLVSLDFTTRSVDVLRESGRVDVEPTYFSIPERIEFPTEDGLTAHAYHYPPTNPDFVAPEGERPPLIVFTHGGPTSETTPEFDLHVQFFTSRGVAVADVNYGGSSGYGREYRERLKGSWGIVDVADCVNAARFLVDRAEADPSRLLISGGSAGGYTTLCALTFHGDVFAAGASHYGVSDLEALARDTHKFESRYLDGLVGPLPEAGDVYRARSPVRFADLLSRPMIILQGLEDEVVPPSQAEVMVVALEAKRIPYAYVAFEGEQHGFRRAENIARSLEAEMSFYAQILDFELADDIGHVEIHNFPAGA